MTFVVAVPSYRRADVFERRAYAALTPNLRRRTYVFVQCREDFDEYSTRFPDVIVVAVKDSSGRWRRGIGYALRCAREHFPLEQEICVLHDDVGGIVKREAIASTGQRCATKDVRLSRLIPKVFARMHELHVKLAGVYSDRGDQCRRPAETLGSRSSTTRFISKSTRDSRAANTKASATTR